MRRALGLVEFGVGTLTVMLRGESRITDRFPDSSRCLFPCLILPGRLDSHAYPRRERRRLLLDCLSGGGWFDSPEATYQI